ncbi:hypothetical protein B1812_15840 [Methylocystis bryophila]|uniref:Uncharacterized protein n=1 Tax=Methylocystis bryophila TaxID=655015 RepID=A0A1W6MXS0_9HYPH|nr:hypothetical protein B1812_15840 [Methylocystis bryophila]
MRTCLGVFDKIRSKVSRPIYFESLSRGAFSASYFFFSAGCGQKVHIKGHPTIVVISKVGIGICYSAIVLPPGSQNSDRRLASTTPCPSSCGDVRPRAR